MNEFPAGRTFGLSLNGWFVAVILILGIVLGGGTRPGFLADTVLQLACLPILLILLVKITGARTPARIRWVALAATLPAVVAAVQLIPVPPSIWAMTPLKPVYAQAFELTSVAPRWMPLTVDATATRSGLLALFPPLAVFLAALLIDRAERRRATLVLLGIGLISVLLGILQVAQGPSSPLRMFPFTNQLEAVGFFANRNHFAALTYVLLLFAAIWAIQSMSSLAEGSSNTRNQTTTIVKALGWFTMLVILIAAAALTKSRTGVVLSIAALLIAFVLAMVEGRKSQARTSTWLLTGSFLAAVTLSGQFVLFRIFERFSFDPLADGRIAFARATAKAAAAYMPFGSGLGTFVPVYAGIERPQDAIANIYANHAHNDYLEYWLEAGIPGLAVLALFAAWLASRGFALIRRTPDGIAGLDLALARAALSAIVLLALHSLLDYPLRTSALMITMAFCCAMLVDPAFKTATPMPARDATPAPSDAHRSARPAPPVAMPFPQAPPSPGGVQKDASQPRALWGDATEWPKEWTESGQTGSRNKSESAPEGRSSNDWWKKPPEKT